ncbi:WDR45B_3 [Blepharisma stoltei]|uniref:WD repeat domain phosphoinositide-interacting protein 3 n=1 Tax=Blepharisma stoltei TaxID=1481888 RepID=A0AAU9K2W7_9CILI|nr:unnamed protein product [Blepharisma stoltei]
MDSVNSQLCIRFNQDATCFVQGTNSGFKIFNSCPIKFCFKRDLYGGIGFVELLYRSNILALVGGGNSPRFPITKVIIWDDHQMRPTGELCFREEVKGVRLRRDRIIVILDTKIYVYNLQDLKMQDHIDTAPNPKALCCVSNNSSRIVLACPDKERGKIRVNIYNEERSLAIQAHESAISCISLNPEGTLVATASDKGTLIRVFNVETGDIRQELRRGIDRAEIYCLAFHPDSNWLACSSDKGTIHIFSIGAQRPQNPRSNFSFMKRLLPKYFDSEWSFAQFRVKNVRTLCAFIKEGNKIVCINDEGSYYLVSFNEEEGGDCVVDEQHQLVDLEV